MLVSENCWSLRLSALLFEEGLPLLSSESPISKLTVDFSSNDCLNFVFWRVVGDEVGELGWT